MSFPALAAMMLAAGTALAVLVAAVALVAGSLALVAGIVGSIAGFLAAIELRWRAWARGTAAPALGWRAHASEFLAVVRLGIWQVSSWVPAWREPRGRPVLAVHGYTQNGANFEGLRRELAAIGRPVRTVFLGFAWPWRSVAGHAAPLIRALERHREQGVDLVAHSMGGLVLRWVLHHHPHLRPAVRSVVTVGSPHDGTALAHRFGWVPAAADLTHGSRFVRRLPTLGELLPHARLATVGSRADRVVYPVESTTQPGVAHVEFDDIGHVGLLVDGRALRAVIEALNPGSPPGGVGWTRST